MESEAHIFRIFCCVTETFKNALFPHDFENRYPPIIMGTLSQQNKNIILNSLNDNQDIIINENFSVKPFQVPHRNELSETVGFIIKGAKKSIVYLPDIDSWKNFKNALFELIKYNNLLFLDGTFYSKKEIY